jgi:esterase/lipase superfamily enzyme
MAFGRTPAGGAAAQAIPTARRLGLAGLLVGVLFGCGNRGTISVVEGSQAPGTVTHPVVVATSRAAAPAPEFFSEYRDFNTNFARFEVSVPPDRKPGTITYPKGEPDPSTDFVVTKSQHLGGPRSFVNEVNAAAAELPRSSRVGIVFVHGFNTNFAESLFKEVQLNHDLETPGVDVLFSWPSEAKLLAYVADRENALFSREALADTLRLMARTNLESYNLVAHSMGTFLAMETLRSLALAGEHSTLNKIKSVILISADLEVDVFRRQAPPILAAGIPILLLVSDDDKALKLSAVVRGERKRVGQVRTKEELGGIDVAIIDLSGIKSSGGADHLKIGTSPELIAFIQRIRKSGVAIFDDGQKVGILDQGAALIQNATGVILSPLGQ